LVRSSSFTVKPNPLGPKNLTASRTIASGWRLQFLQYRVISRRFVGFLLIHREKLSKCTGSPSTGVYSFARLYDKIAEPVKSIGENTAVSISS
jgi:hypothetical protein